MYFGMPTSASAANVPKGMTWQQYQLSQQSAQRMRNLQQFGDPTKLQRERNYQSKLNQWISPSPAPTPPRSTGVPTPEYIKKLRDYEGQMAQRRQTQSLFDPLSSELAMGQVPGYELSPQRQREIEQMQQARNYEEAQRFQQSEQLRIGEQLARQAQGISTRARQDLSPSRINYQLENLKRQNESIRAELEKGPPTLSQEQIAEIDQRARQAADDMIGQQISSQEERIKQNFASRNMYGSDAMNAALAELRSTYAGQRSSIIKSETQRLTQKFTGNVDWTSRRSELQRMFDENMRQINELASQRTQQESMIRNLGYENVYEDLRRRFLPRMDYTGLNPYMQGVM